MGVPIRDRGHEMLGTVGLFVALSTITVAMRTYCRISLVKNFGLDDYLAVVAWALFMLYSAFAILGVHHGTGQHAWNLPDEVLPVGLKWWWACEPAYILAMMATKASICVFLLRIAVKPVHKYVIWGVLIIHELYSTAFLFIFIFQCYPSQYFWTKYTGGSGSCLDPKVTVDTLYAFSAISCAGDWILGLLPIAIVWTLQMNRRTKMSVAGILAVGAIASSATIIRIPYIHGMSNIADFLYATTDVAIWSTVELGIGISAMCAATLRPMFRVMLGSSGYGSRTGRTSQPWGTPADRPSGYIRSHGFDDGFMLRGDIAKGGGTTATVRAGDEESFTEGTTFGRDTVKGKDSIDKLTGDSESDEWRITVTKTTKMTQSSE